MGFQSCFLKNLYPALQNRVIHIFAGACNIFLFQPQGHAGWEGGIGYAAAFTPKEETTPDVKHKNASPKVAILCPVSSSSSSP